MTSREVFDRAKKIELIPFLASHYGLMFNGHDLAVCPFHDDHNPSFSVFEGKDGNWRWQCLGCGAHGDILDFIKRKDGVEGREALARIGVLDSVLPSKVPSGANRRGEPIATYVYHDKSGHPLYRKVKYSSRDFSTQRHEGGRWKPGLKGIRPVLYDLPELVQATQVLLLEGEKDCETVKGLGYVATTMGSKNQWRSEFATYFTGKDVFICLDVGNEAEAEKIAQGLSSLAKSLRILPLPGLVEREQDITDWFELMGDASPDKKRARLEEVIEKTPLYKAEAPKPMAGIMTLTEFMNKPLPPRDVLVKFWAEKGQLTILGGPQKSGKSTLAVNVGLSLVLGKNFMDFDVPRPRRVLYIQQEISEAAMQERVRKMLGSTPPSSVAGFMLRNTAGHPLKLTRSADKDSLRRLLQEGRADLVILDPLSTFHDKDENSATEMSEVLGYISELIAKSGAGVLLIHHFGKPSIAQRHGSHKLRGSSVLGDRADALILLEPLFPGQPTDRLPLPADSYGRISFLLRNDAQPSPITVERDPLTLWYRTVHVPSLYGRKILPAHIVDAVKNHGGSARQDEIVEELRPKASRGTVLKVIREAESAGLLEPPTYLPEKGRPAVLKIKDLPS